MIGPEITAPDLTEAVIGYRQFALNRATQHNYKLCSPHQGTPWEKPAMSAKCTVEIKVPEGLILPRPPEPHPAPAKNCGCGIYAYFDPCPVASLSHYDYQYASGTGLYVEALMTLEGRIEVHDRGMRAERAKVCALGLNPNIGHDALAGLREIASRWNVPLVDQRDLPRLAPEYGRVLGKELRPAVPDSQEQNGDLSVSFVGVRYDLVEPRPSLWRWAPTGCNATASATNLALFAAHGSVINISMAAFSAAVAYIMRPKARRT